MSLTFKFLTVRRSLLFVYLMTLLNGCATTEPRISFGYYEPYPGNRHFHTGVDISMALGEPILAAADGIVRRAQTVDIYLVSKSVEIDHGDDISTDYQHMDTVLVKVGQQVKRGEKIGTVGETGRLGGFQSNREPTGRPHLHFEVYKGMGTRDPTKFIVGCFDPKRTYKPLEMIWPTGCF